MLISHRYKFIYIKNAKVAGTSVEAFFEKYCLNPDKKYVQKLGRKETISEFGIIGKRAGKYENFKRTFRGHLPAPLIKKEIGEELFNEYFKFCVVRNPYDKMVSLYFYAFQHMKFKDFCKKKKEYNWDIHTIDNKLVCDYFIRFENLEEDIIKVCEKLDITDYNIKDLPKYYGNYRPNDAGYKKYYNEETRNLVYKNHQKEFEMFGYEF